MSSRNRTTRSTVKHHSPAGRINRLHMKALHLATVKQLATLDGSDEAAVSLVTGFSRDEIRDLGGIEGGK